MHPRKAGRFHHPQFTMGQVYTIFPIAGVLCILSAVLNLVVELTTKPEGGESK